MNVRILAPTGELGSIPEDQVEAAVAAGAKVMTPADMRALRQSVFMEHTVFDERNRKPTTRRQRKSLWKGRGR